MGKLVLAAALLLLATSLSALAQEPTLGVYKLTGTNPGDPSKGYSGKVTIEKDGEAFRLRWYIGEAQQQAGVAYASGDVLSVGYMDLSGRDSGVVSYRIVNERRLEGKWCPLGSKVCGTELLELETTSQHGEDKAETVDPTTEPERLPASAPFRKPERFTI